MNKDAEAADFVQSLVTKTQFLASLNWLCRFHVLAFIPSTDSVAIQELADVIGVPYTHLSGVVHLVTSAGFLRMPQPGEVAHTPLSSHFTTKPSLLDAIGFICETALPAAMRFPEGTQALIERDDMSLSVFRLLSPDNLSLADECERQPKLGRQLSAYQRSFERIVDDGKKSVLLTFDWPFAGNNITVVHVGIPSAGCASAVAERHFNLQTILQPYDDSKGDSTTMKGFDVPPALSNRFSVQRRVQESQQTVLNAGVYILHVPLTSPSGDSKISTALVATELKVHLNVLRVNPQAKLILLMALGMEAGRLSRKADAVSRSYGLSLLQLCNDDLMSMAQLEALLDGVRDTSGKLAVSDISVSRDHFIVAVHVTAVPHR